MIMFQRRFVSVGEVWFDQEPEGLSVDVVEYRQRSTPIAGASWLMLVQFCKKEAA